MLQRLEHIKYIIDKHSSELLARLKVEGRDITVEGAIDTLLACDPSEGKKLTDWLVKTYIGGGFRWEDVEIEAESKLAEVLGLYQTYFNQIPRDQRNIYECQSYGELYKLVEPYLPMKLNNETLGSREIKRRERARALEESEVLYRSEDIIVSVPLTETASKWWGRGTKWCTAADKNNYFHHYNKDAPLIVITLLNPCSSLMNNYSSGNRKSSVLNKSSARGVEKFQLWTDGNQIQFMDSSDTMVNDTAIEDYWNLLEPVFIGFIRLNRYFLEWIPYNLRTTEFCKRSVEINGRALEYVPKELITFELCLIAVEQNGNALEYVPIELLNDELCMLSVKDKQDAVLYHIPENFKTAEICTQAVMMNGNALYNVPKKLITQELCWIAVKQAPGAIEHVPIKLRLPELCLSVINQMGICLRDVPEEHITAELCMQAVRNNGRALYYVPNKFISADICIQAVKSNGLVLERVPSQYITPEMYRLAVEQTGFALDHIPENLITPELCRIAVEKDGEALRYVPRELTTPELCRMAVERYKLALIYIPEELRTIRLIELIGIHHQNNKLPNTDWDKSILTSLKNTIHSYIERQTNDAIQSHSIHNR